MIAGFVLGLKVGIPLGHRAERRRLRLGRKDSDTPRLDR
jgi:hypothetical protein